MKLRVIEARVIRMLRPRPGLKYSKSYFGLCYSLRLSYTPTDILIMLLFFLKTFNDSLLHFESSQSFSAFCIRLFIQRLNLSISSFPPCPAVTEESRPTLGIPVSMSLFTFFPVPQTSLSSTHASYVLKQES